MKAFVRYDGKGQIVSSSLIVMKDKPDVGDWVEVPIHRPSLSVPIFKTPFYRALIRYDSKNNIVPGSLIITKSRPSIGNWYEVAIRKCCVSTTTTTEFPN